MKGRAGKWKELACVLWIGRHEGAASGFLTMTRALALREARSGVGLYPKSQILAKLARAGLKLEPGEVRRVRLIIEVPTP